MAAPKKIDYERIEAGWRAGLLSPHQLAAQYTEDTGQKVSHAAIIKHFKKQGVSRDLSSKIMDRANSMVTEAMVTGKVTKEPTIPDSEIIEAGACHMADIRFTHRKDIRRLHVIANSLLDELEHQAGVEAAALLSELGEIMREPDESGQDKRNDLYRKIISLPERSKTAKTLADTMRVAVDMERQAFNMDAKGADGTPGAPGYIPPSISVSFVSPPRRDEDEAEE